MLLELYSGDQIIVSCRFFCSSRNINCLIFNGTTVKLQMQLPELQKYKKERRVKSTFDASPTALVYISVRRNTFLRTTVIKFVPFLLSPIFTWAKCPSSVSPNYRRIGVAVHPALFVSCHFLQAIIQFITYTNVDINMHTVKVCYSSKWSHFGRKFFLHF